MINALGRSEIKVLEPSVETSMGVRAMSLVRTKRVRFARASRRLSSALIIIHQSILISHSQPAVSCVCMAQLCQGGESGLQYSDSQIPSLRVHDRLISLFELLPIPLHISPAIQAEFEVLCEFQARRGAGILTQAAEHASGNVER